MRPILILTGLCLAATAGASDDCDYTAEHPIALDAQDLLEIKVGAGALRVSGRPGPGVVGTVTLCASEPELLQQYLINIENGSRGLISIEAPQARGGWFGSHYARAHVDIEVPQTQALKIDDGSGGMLLTKVGDVEIDDGSGSIEIRGASNVTVDDGSGNMVIHDVAGLVLIDDGSGGIEVKGANSVVVTDDGSGDIHLSGIRGDAIVEDDGSGSVFFSDIAGRAIVEHDGSGSVRAENVAGEFYHPGMRK